MIENASKYGLAHRHHVKSHRSSELAKITTCLWCERHYLRKIGGSRGNGSKWYQ
jgi:hypothetical protein